MEEGTSVHKCTFVYVFLGGGFLLKNAKSEVIRDPKDQRIQCPSLIITVSSTL